MGSSLDYPRTPLLVGENDDTSLSELEQSMSPHPQVVYKQLSDCYTFLITGKADKASGHVGQLQRRGRRRLQHPGLFLTGLLPVRIYICHVFTCTCAQDDGGESTEPENQGNTLYFGQQVGKSLITDDDEQLLWIWRNVYILLWWSGGEGRGVHGERNGCGGVEEKSKKVTCLPMKDMWLQQKMPTICLHQM